MEADSCDTYILRGSRDALVASSSPFEIIMTLLFLPEQLIFGANVAFAMDVSRCCPHTPDLGIFCRDCPRVFWEI